MIRCALVLLILTSAADVRAAPVKPTSTRVQQQRDFERRARTAYRRVRKELARGVPLDEIKLPEAAAELDHFIEAVKGARATHAPLKAPTAEMEALLRDEDVVVVDGSIRVVDFGPRGRAIPAKWSDRYDDRSHPHFLRELSYLDKVVEHGEQLRRDGIPYRRYLDFVANHLPVALDLHTQVFPEQPVVIPAAESTWKRPTTMLGQRPDVDELVKDGALVERADREKAGTGADLFPIRPQRLASALYFPASTKLGFGAFNRVAGHRLHFIGLPTLHTDRTGDFGDFLYSAISFVSHDLSHSIRRMELGFARDDTTQIGSVRLARRFQRAVARVADPKTRLRMQEMFFNAFHEDEMDVSIGHLEKAFHAYQFDSEKSDAAEHMRAFIASERARADATKKETP